MKPVVLVALVLSVFLAGCHAEQMMSRASGAVEAFATKGLDKFDPETILADATVDATNPEVEGEAEFYQSWGVRWRNRYNGLIARGSLHMAGKGGVSDDAELRQLIREKLGDPVLKQLDALMSAGRPPAEPAAPPTEPTEPAAPPTEPTEPAAPPTEPTPIVEPAALRWAGAGATPVELVSL